MRYTIFAMKKLLILTVLPLLALSCSRTDKGQQEVSFPVFCLNWKSVTATRSASVAYAHTVINKDSKDWNYITNGDEQDVPFEERLKEDENNYIFSLDGTCVAEHEAITSFKPHALTLDHLYNFGLNAESTKFYINPMRVVIEINGYDSYQSPGDASNREWLLQLTYEYTFNKQMWITNYTVTSMQTIYYNGESGWISSIETNDYTYTYF